MNAKTKTKRFAARDFISNAGQLNLTRLVDSAVEALGFIRINGVGDQRRRSRGVVFTSFCDVAQQAGYDERAARSLWRDQVVALDELNANSEEV